MVQLSVAQLADTRANDFPTSLPEVLPDVVRSSKAALAKELSSPLAPWPTFLRPTTTEYIAGAFSDLYKHWKDLQKTIDDLSLHESSCLELDVFVHDWYPTLVSLLPVSFLARIC
jgi:hypothetical protein